MDNLNNIFPLSNKNLIPSVKISGINGSIVNKVNSICDINDSITKKVHYINGLRKILEEPSKQGNDLIKIFEKQINEIINFFPKNIFLLVKEIQNIDESILLNIKNFQKLDEFQVEEFDFINELSGLNESNELDGAGFNLEGLNELKGLNLDEDEEVKKIENIDEDVYTNENEGGFEFFNEKEEVLMKEREKLDLQKQELLKNIDVKFVYLLLEGFKKLQEKGNIFENEKGKYFKNGVWNNNSMGEEKGLLNIKEINSYGLSLYTILSSEEFEKYFQKNCAGVFVGKIHLLIKDNDNQELLKDTIKHENIHNVYEVFTVQNMLGFENIKNNINRYIEFIDLGASFILEESEALLFNNILLFVDSSRGEIISNYEGLLKGEISTELMESRELLNLLKNYEEELKNKGINLDFFSKFFNKLKNTIKEFYLDLADLLFIAQKLGIQEDMKSLLILYKPKEYKNIFKYLFHIYGEKQICYLKGLRLFVKEPFYNLINKDDLKTKEQKLADTIFNKFIKSDKEDKNEEFGINSKLKDFSIENLQNIINNQTGQIFLNKEEKNKILFGIENLNDFIKDFGVKDFYLYFQKLLHVLKIFHIDYDEEDIDIILINYTNIISEKIEKDGDITFLKEFVCLFINKYPIFIKEYISILRDNYLNEENEFFIQINKITKNQLKIYIDLIENK